MYAVIERSSWQDRSPQHNARLRAFSDRSTGRRTCVARRAHEYTYVSADSIIGTFSIIAIFSTKLLSCAKRYLSERDRALNFLQNAYFNSPLRRMLPPLHCKWPNLPMGFSYEEASSVVFSLRKYTLITLKIVMILFVNINAEVKVYRCVVYNVQCTRSDLHSE